MAQNCKVCGYEMKLIPAGVSKKTNRPYEAFYACPNKCKQPVAHPAAQYFPKDNPNYQAPAVPQTKEIRDSVLVERLQVIEDMIKTMHKDLDEKSTYTFKTLMAMKSALEKEIGVEINDKF